MLRAVAKNGGVVQVNFFSGFDDQTYWDASRAQAKDRDAAIAAFVAKKKADGQTVTYLDTGPHRARVDGETSASALQVLIDHIDHIAKVAGIDHVGLGSDFDGVSGATPQGMNSAADLPKITQALLDRGYSADDIKKILGGNILRVFRQVETVSREMQAPSLVSVSAH